LLTNYDLQDPLSLMEATLPLGPSLGAQLRVWKSGHLFLCKNYHLTLNQLVHFQTSVVDEAIRRKLTAPKILIYHTHSSEMYLGRALTQKQANQGITNFVAYQTPQLQALWPWVVI